MPDLIVISGANGAGKSTLAPYLLRDTLNIVEYVNADTIAQGLSAFAPEMAAIQAGRIMLKRLDELAEKGDDFAFETTLSTRSYARRVKILQSKGYHFQLIYLWLNSAELAVARVQERVRMGGHDIPEETIRRRYERGRRNFLDIYLPLADAWKVYDASASELEKIAHGDKLSGTTIVDEALWKKIND